MLARLRPADMAELLGALLGPRPALSPDWLEHLFRLTEGNPFFVEEVVKSIHAASADAAWPASPPSRVNVPRTVRAAVQ